MEEELGKGVLKWKNNRAKESWNGRRNWQGSLEMEEEIGKGVLKWKKNLAKES
jgi:hypothetical protein